MWGEREIIYLSLHCHHQNDSCIKMGNDESHFNVSVGSDGQMVVIILFCMPTLYKSHTGYIVLNDQFYGCNISD